MKVAITRPIPSIKVARAMSVEATSAVGLLTARAHLRLSSGHTTLSSGHDRWVVLVLALSSVVELGRSVVRVISQA